MKAIEFEESNYLLPPHKDDVGKVVPLPVLIVKPRFTSCWKLNAKELKIIKKTGKIWLVVHGGNHPPVSISAEEPQDVVNVKQYKEWEKKKQEVLKKKENGTQEQ